MKLKWKYLLLVIWIGNPASLSAQKGEAREVRPGENIMHLLTEKERYRYDHFQRGKVHFKDRSTVSATLNYNFLNQEVEFINTTGDTLSIARKYAVDSINIGEQSFYYHPTEGYVEVRDEFPPLKLVVHQSVQAAQNQAGKVIFHDLGSNSHDPLSALGNDQRKLTLINGQEHFVIDKNNRLYPVQRSTLYRMFPKHKTEIRSYLKRHRIDLKREEDLIKALQFCSQMASY